MGQITLLYLFGYMKLVKLLRVFLFFVSFAGFE